MTAVTGLAGRFGSAMDVTSTGVSAASRWLDAALAGPAARDARRRTRCAPGCCGATT
ncbi:hypothetical protein I547_6894 [Mycobacterium kansasii 824]|uniref:Uncharacterized protein n=1 Tax=Mycobacterium kansasii TaxID=1768 RepID=A0A1V3WUG2_MYCKA|nr:hypothetical protein I547_6894 [Mycobacterium kansasii 824]OOK70412.1 hypothetical protein BZL30_6734 [Mycobacterium kansasii]